MGFSGFVLPAADTWVPELHTARQKILCPYPTYPITTPLQDLMALDVIPDLVRAGVACLKIEGRLKGPEYVAVTTAAYRQACPILSDPNETLVI